MQPVSFGYSVHYPDYNISMDALRFKDSFSGDLYSVQHKGTITEIPLSFIDKIRDSVSNIVFDKSDVRVEAGTQDVQIKVSNEFLVQLHFTRNLTGLEFFKRTKVNIVITALGNRDSISSFWQEFLQHIETSSTPIVWWNYLHKDERQATDIFLQSPRPICKELYPWLKDEEPSSYIQRFLDSDSAIIILRGDPGTGKTSFIQNLIWQSGSDAMLTYDEELFKSDEIFVQFITEQRANLLIMEDADLLLTSRIQSGNSAMAKFLNVADGIVHFQGKKLIISANVVKDDSIDHALMRPGRCFDAPVFQRLTYEETQRAATALGIKAPAEDRSYSLAELFSSSKGGPATSPKSPYKFGFSV